MDDPNSRDDRASIDQVVQDDYLESNDSISASPPEASASLPSLNTYQGMSEFLTSQVSDFTSNRDAFQRYNSADQLHSEDLTDFDSYKDTMDHLVLCGHASAGSVYTQTVKMHLGSDDIHDHKVYHLVRDDNVSYKATLNREVCISAMQSATTMMMVADNIVAESKVNPSNESGVSGGVLGLEISPENKGKITALYKTQIAALNDLIAVGSDKSAAEVSKKSSKLIKKFQREVAGIILPNKSSPAYKDKVKLLQDMVEGVNTQFATSSIIEHAQMPGQDKMMSKAQGYVGGMSQNQQDISSAMFGLLSDHYESPDIVSNQSIGMSDSGLRAKLNEFNKSPGLDERDTKIQACKSLLGMGYAKRIIFYQNMRNDAKGMLAGNYVINGQNKGIAARNASKVMTFSTPSGGEPEVLTSDSTQASLIGDSAKLMLEQNIEMNGLTSESRRDNKFLKRSEKDRDIDHNYFVNVRYHAAPPSWNFNPFSKAPLSVPFNLVTNIKFLKNTADNQVVNNVFNALANVLPVLIVAAVAVALALPVLIEAGVRTALGHAPANPPSPWYADIVRNSVILKKFGSSVLDQMLDSIQQTELFASEKEAYSKQGITLVSVKIPFGDEVGMTMAVMKVDTTEFDSVIDRVGKVVENYERERGLEESKSKGAGDQATNDGDVDVFRKCQRDYNQLASRPIVTYVDRVRLVVALMKLEKAAEPFATLRFIVGCARNKDRGPGVLSLAQLHIIEEHLTKRDINGDPEKLTGQAKLDFEKGESLMCELMGRSCMRSGGNVNGGSPGMFGSKAANVTASVGLETVSKGNAGCNKFKENIKPGLLAGLKEKFGMNSKKSSADKKSNGESVEAEDRLSVSSVKDDELRSNDFGSMTKHLDAPKPAADPSGYVSLSSVDRDSTAEKLGR